MYKEWTRLARSQNVLVLEEDGSGDMDPTSLKSCSGLCKLASGGKQASAHPTFLADNRPHLHSLAARKTPFQYLRYRRDWPLWWRVSFNCAAPTDQRQTRLICPSYQQYRRHLLAVWSVTGPGARFRPRGSSEDHLHYPSLQPS